MRLQECHGNIVLIFKVKDRHWEHQHRCVYLNSIVDFSDRENFAHSPVRRLYWKMPYNLTITNNEMDYLPRPLSIMILLTPITITITMTNRNMIKQTHSHRPSSLSPIYWGAIFERMENSYSKWRWVCHISRYGRRGRYDWCRYVNCDDRCGNTGDSS